MFILATRYGLSQVVPPVPMGPLSGSETEKILGIRRDVDEHDTLSEDMMSVCSQWLSACQDHQVPSSTFCDWSLPSPQLVRSRWMAVSNALGGGWIIESRNKVDTGPYHNDVRWVIHIFDMSSSKLEPS